MAKDLLAELGIESSEKIDLRNIKMMFYGATATWKTETVLRNLPHVLVIDAEGNTDQCVDVPEIPPFLRVKTKDPRKVIQIIDMVAAGKLKFTDGLPIETVCIDSVSVLWSVQQEVAIASAEGRATRKGWSADSATLTQLDWGLAKRQMKLIQNRLAGSPIKFLVLIAREKDLYKDTNGQDDKLIKIGVQADCVKGTQYDMNLVLHFTTENGKWGATVEKVQGGLKSVFPLQGKLNKFPMPELLAYAQKVKPSLTNEKDEDQIAREIADAASEPHDQATLIRFASSQGVQKEQLGAVLKEAGFKGFTPEKWDEMKAAVITYASIHNLQEPHIENV
jgi:hypothetical protein